MADVYELVNLIFKFSGQSVDLETVQEWFCNERMVDFRCFLQSLVEAYAGLLQVRALSLFSLSLLSPSLSLSVSVNWKILHSHIVTKIFVSTSHNYYLCTFDMLLTLSTPPSTRTNNNSCAGECYPRSLHEAVSEAAETGQTDEEGPRRSQLEVEMVHSHNHRPTLLRDTRKSHSQGVHECMKLQKAPYYSWKVWTDV